MIGDARAPLPRDCRGVSQTRFIGSAQSIGHRVHLAPIEDLHRALQAVSLDGPHRPGHAELMGSTCSLTAELASGSRPPCVPKAMPPAPGPAASSLQLPRHAQIAGTDAAWAARSVARPRGSGEIDHLHDVSRRWAELGCSS